MLQVVEQVDHGPCTRQQHPGDSNPLPSPLLLAPGGWAHKAVLTGKRANGNPLRIEENQRHPKPEGNALSDPGSTDPVASAELVGS